MGSQHSHEKGAGEPGSAVGSRRGSSRRSSGGGGGGSGSEQPPPQPEKAQPCLVPIDKLAKLLAQRSQKEDGVNGITENSVTKYIFPKYPELAQQFYRAAVEAAGPAGAGDRGHVTAGAFRQHCEKVLAMIEDAVIIDTYVRMFSSGPAEGAERTLSQADLRRLLYTSYKISMDHYPEGPQTCLSINKTLTAVVAGCFGTQAQHSAGFVVRWLDEHVHRVLLPTHRYVVHTLSTLYRALLAAPPPPPGGSSRPPSPPAPPLSPPVLEDAARGSLAGSHCWLLAAALPPLYSRPPAPPAPPASAQGANSRQDYHGGGGSLAAAWVSRLVCAVPSHWSPLYRSEQHGLGANRFLHHTLQYRGPTLVVFQCAELTLVVASPQEWKETHQYWGGPDCALLQLYPTFSVIERGPKMLYLNTSIRGYPVGLRAGSDPRRPLLAVSGDFDSLLYRDAPYALHHIEVWGCGDQASRETQLDIKKWQVKEAERQRQIKISAADWIEHPDRYLLELAGRPQYNNSNK